MTYDMRAAVGRGDYDRAQSMALVSIAESLAQLVQLRAAEYGGFDAAELFACYREVVDTGPLPGGDDE